MPNQFLYSVKNDAKALPLYFKEQKTQHNKKKTKKNNDHQTLGIKL
jgi:hypothetical protein